MNVNCTNLIERARGRVAMPVDGPAVLEPEFVYAGERDDVIDLRKL